MFDIHQLCSHGAIQFTVYEALKTSESLRAATSSVVGVSVDPTNSLYMFALAGLSKMTAATATFPLMTVRSRMQARPLFQRFCHSFLSLAV